MKTHDALVFVSLLLTGCAAFVPVATQWEYTEGPSAQNVSAALVDGRAPSTLYAGLSNGEVHFSTNHGALWTHLSTIQKERRIIQLVQDPENGAKLFAATEGGLFLSTTSGKEWSEVRVEAGATTSITCRVVAIEPWNTTVVYAGLQGRGVYRSTDGGTQWAPINGGPEGRLATADIHDITIDLMRPDVVYAAAGGVGLVKSTDAGNTWSYLTEGSSTVGAIPTAVVISTVSDEMVVYATNTGNIFKSTNAGQSWGPTRYGLEADQITSMVASPSDPALLFAGSATGVLISTDFGTTWGPAPGTLPRLNTTVTVSPAKTQPTLLAFGSGIGLQRSTDSGRSWSHADSKLGGATVTRVSIDREARQVYAVVGQTLLSQGENHTTWEPASTGLLGTTITSLAFDAFSPLTLYATTSAGAFRSTDAGGSWQPFARTMRMTPDFLDAHPTFRTRMFASGDQGLFTSTDRGNSWVQAKPVGSRFRVRSLTYTPTNAGVIHAATPDQGMITTTDGGFVWETRRYGLTGNEIIAVTLDDTDPQTLYAFTPSGNQFRSTNGGIEWNRYAPPWKATDTVMIAYDRHQPSSVIALVNAREIYYSPSGGGAWFNLVEHMLQAEVQSLCWHAESSLLYAGIKDKGVYRINLGEILRDRFEE